MTRSTAAGRAPEKDWQIERLRLTLFHAPTDEVNADGWWQRVVGEAPESSVSKPRSGERIEIGAIAGAQLLLHAQRQTGRLDWVMQAVDHNDRPAIVLPEGVDVFRKMMEVFLDLQGLPQVSRMAVGVISLLPTLDLSEGYRTLCDYLNFDIDRATSSDFLYQINHRRKSVVLPNREVNRLMRWSVGLYGQQAFAVGEEGLIALAGLEGVVTFCRAELDINTVPIDGRNISASDLRPLFSEYLGMAREILREGDVP